MELKPGSRLRSAVCDTEIVVTRSPKSTVALSCGGHPMLVHGSSPGAGLEIAEAFSSGTLMGKRYTDAQSGLEVMCSKGGKGALSVDGRVMAAKETKALPASD